MFGFPLMFHYIDSQSIDFLQLPGIVHYQEVECIDFPDVFIRFAEKHKVPVVCHCCFISRNLNLLISLLLSLDVSWYPEIHMFLSCSLPGIAMH